MYTVPLAALGAADLPLAGGKGAHLGELLRAGLPVPPGFVLTTEAHAAGMTPEVRDALLEAYAALGAGPVAVRSSATAEDLPDASFAGQQETVLDVRGPDALVDAVQRCWASLWSARAVAYRDGHADAAGGRIGMAVVVQAMVDADAAGVMFTANPATGARDETVISAAWGLGESVVGGSVTTDDLVVDAAGGVRSRRTADKAVMTVATGHGTTEVAVAPARRRLPVLDDAAAATLARLGARVQEHFGVPQDVEWARADGAFLLVQARPVTVLPDPAPTAWPLPDPTGTYVRASIVEQLPDPLSPLFADLVDPAVSRSLRALLGDRVLRDGDVGLPTINGYAYYHYSRRGMLRMLAATPRLLLLLRGAVADWREVARPRYASTVERWARRGLDLPAGTLLDAAAELVEAGCTYYTSVQKIIPVAVLGEACFTRFYDALVRRAGDPPAPTFLLGSDSTPIRAEKSLHDLAVWTREAGLAAELADGVPRSAPWQARFAEHLRRYGHTVYTLDPVNPVPTDDPAPLLDTLRYLVDSVDSVDGGTDPRERQRRAVDRREEAAAAVRARLDPARRAAFDRLLRWARDSAPVREDALADVGLAWPLIRRMLHEIGRRLTAAGAVTAPEDVHWLRLAEVRALAVALDEDPSVRLPDRSGDIAARRRVWRGRRRAQPPQMLPRSTWMRVFDRFMPAADGAGAEADGTVLRGTPAGAGRVTGRARVLAGPSDFARLGPGDVLVASITTPAWTPLFARAAAVVTDIGGPLSHSSIVAREYGIPAVLGTGVATRRVPDGARVRVDGDVGTVTVLDAGGEVDGAGGADTRTRGADARTGGADSRTGGAGTPGVVGGPG